MPCHDEVSWELVHSVPVQIVIKQGHLRFLGIHIVLPLQR